MQRFTGSKSGGPQPWAQQKGKMGGGCGTPSGTQRELSEKLAGGALKSMEMFEEKLQDGDPEPNIRNESLTAAGKR